MNEEKNDRLWSGRLKDILSRNKVKAFPRQAFYDVLLVLEAQEKAKEEKDREFLKELSDAAYGNPYNEDLENLISKYQPKILPG